MRRTPLAVVVLVGAVAAGAACNSTGTSTFNPLGTFEPAPSSTDTPPSTWEQPPASGDTPPSSVDPTPGAACTGCRGTFTCPESGDTFSITLREASGACNLTASSDGMSFSVTAACGDEAGDSGGGNGGFTYSVGAHGSLTACDGSNGCIVCTPGGAGAMAPDASVTITVGGGGGGGGGGGNCDTLMSCCSSLPSLEQSSCLSTVQLGNDSICESAVQDYQAIQLCQ